MPEAKVTSVGPQHREGLSGLVLQPGGAVHSEALRRPRTDGAHPFPTRRGFAELGESGLVSQHGVHDIPPFVRRHETREERREAIHLQVLELVGDLICIVEGSNRTDL